MQQYGVSEPSQNQLLYTTMHTLRSLPSPPPSAATAPLSDVLPSAELPHTFSLGPAVSVRVCEDPREPGKRCVDVSFFAPTRRGPIFRVSSEHVPPEHVPEIIRSVEEALPPKCIQSFTSPPKEVIWRLSETLKDLQVPGWGKVIGGNTLVGEAATPDTMADTYERVLNRVANETSKKRAARIEARVVGVNGAFSLRAGSLRDLCEKPGAGRVLWLNLVQPSNEQLTALCKTFGFAEQTVFSPSESQHQFDQWKCGKDALGFTLLEPRRSKDSSQETTFHDVRVFMKEGVLITVTDQPCNFLEWVAGELQRRENPIKQISAHALAVRMIGSCLHENGNFLNALFKDASELRSRWAGTFPSQAEQGQIESIGNTASQVGRYILNGVGLLDHLGQEDHLCGAAAKSPRLAEYQKRCEGIRKLAEDIEKIVNSLYQSWNTNAEREASQYQIRLAYLAAVVGPASLVAGIFGMNSLPAFEPKMMYLSVAGAVVASLGLLFGMRYKLKQRQH